MAQDWIVACTEHLRQLRSRHCPVGAGA